MLLKNNLVSVTPPFPFPTPTKGHQALLHHPIYQRYATDSWLVFLRLNELEAGDEVILKDSIGNEYLYGITRATVVGPQQVEVMNAAAGRSIVSLQTCTLPAFPYVAIFCLSQLLISGSGPFG